MSSVLLRIELLGIEPLIWRRVRVPVRWTLKRLHGLIQSAFGWENRHLHDFRIGDVSIGMPDIDDDRPGLQDESEWTIAEVQKSGTTEFLYVYDFGDWWQHRIVIESEQRTGAGARFAPICLAGENAAPPEDVGGLPGYEEFRAALADPNHERHEELVNWIGGVFDPKAFDLNRAQSQAATLRVACNRSSGTRTLALSVRRCARRDRGAARAQSSE